MKKPLLLLCCLLLPVVLPAQESDYAAEIAKFAERTAQNTVPSTYDRFEWGEWVGFICTLISVTLAFISVHFAFVTVRNVTVLRIKHRAQIGIYGDIVRHLYRNKVMLCTLRWKMDNEGGFEKCYPSEEHILSLKLLPEDLHLDKFEASSSEYYANLHKLSLNLRNFNLKAEVTASHLKSPSIPARIKQAELDFLEFESQRLVTDLIVPRMQELGESTPEQRIKKHIEKDEPECHSECIDSDCFMLDRVPTRREAPLYRARYTDDGEEMLELQPQGKYRYHDDVLGMGDKLNKAISRKYSSINLIPLADATK